MSRVIAIVLAASILHAIPPPVHGQLRGDAELLKTAALQHRANRDGLLTWTGSVTVTEHLDRPTPRGERFVWETESRVEFVCDVRRKASRWQWRYVSGADPKHPASRNLDGLVKDEQYFQCRLFGNGPSRYLVIQPLDQLHPGAPPYFLPQWFFRIHDADGLDRRLEFYYDGRDHPKNVAVVKREGSVVVLEIKRNALNRYEIDLEQGGNPRAYLAEEPGLSFEWQYKWERVSNIWVPKRVIYTRRRQEDDGRVDVYRAEYLWDENTVNEPVDAAEFELPALGVRAGDTVYDKFTGTTYTYKAADLLGQAESENTWPVYRVFLVGATAVLSAVLVVAYIRRGTPTRA